MKRLAANVIVAIFGAMVATVLGAEIRQDWQVEEPVRDFMTGATVGTAAMAVKWAMAELESEPQHG